MTSESGCSAVQNASLGSCLVVDVDAENFHTRAPTSLRSLVQILFDCVRCKVTAADLDEIKYCIVVSWYLKLHLNSVRVKMCV